MAKARLDSAKGRGLVFGVVAEEGEASVRGEGGREGKGVAIVAGGEQERVNPSRVSYGADCQLSAVSWGEEEGRTGEVEGDEGEIGDEDGDGWRGVARRCRTN